MLRGIVRGVRAFFGPDSWSRSSRPAIDLSRDGELEGQKEGLDLPELRFEVGVESDPGCHRSVNEDAFSWIPSPDDSFHGGWALLLVADGMGGAAGGATASALAVEAVARYFYESGLALADSVARAGRDIFQLSRRKRDLAGMGTTCVALAVGERQALAAYVGDSRIYLLRNQQIFQMTEDHSVVQELVRAGQLTPGEARDHEDRNIISRALGTKKTVEVAVWERPFPLRAGDRFVVSTDGLHDLVEDQEILGIAGASSPPNACEELIRLARDRGGYDNITVAVVAVASVTEAEDEAPETRELGVLR